MVLHENVHTILLVFVTEYTLLLEIILIINTMGDLSMDTDGPDKIPVLVTGKTFEAWVEG